MLRSARKNGNFQLARQGVERNAEQGEPAPVFPDDGDRLLAPAGAGCGLAGRAEVDDGNAAGHWRVPGQGEGACGVTEQQGEEQGAMRQLADRLAHHKRRRSPISLV